MASHLFGRGAAIASCAGALLAALGVASTHAAPATQGVRSCGDLPSVFVFHITTRRVTCVTGRRVARQWASQCAQIRTGSCLTTTHFYCRYRDSGYESGTIRCVYELDLRLALTRQRAVRFSTGS